VKERHLFTSFHFPPNKFYWNLQFFPLTFEVLLYHGYRSLFTHFFPFLWSINYDCASQNNNSSTHSLSIWLKIEDLSFFLSLTSWHRTWSHLTGPKPHKRMKKSHKQMKKHL
jgi:hypothetical protein